MILNEIFDQTLPFQLIGNGGSFDVEGHTYAVQFAPVGTTADVELAFGLGSSSKKTPTGKFSHGILGTGNELVVFSTVIAMVRKYVSQHPTHLVRFGAALDEPSRIKLYDRLVSRLLPPGWKVSTTMKAATNQKLYWLINGDYKQPGATNDTE